MALIPHHRQPQLRFELRTCLADWHQSVNRNDIARAGSIRMTAKRLSILLFLAASVLLFLRLATDSSAQITSSTVPPAASKTDQQAKTIADAYGRLELSFIPNKGQTDQQVKFLSHGPGYDLFLTGAEAVVVLRKPGALHPDKFKGPTPNDQRAASSVLKLQMIGVDPNAQVEGREELLGKINYFIGNNRDEWLVNVPTFRKVAYRNIYRGIDLIYYGNQRQLEYDFIVQPGANPATIRFRVEGADTISVAADGDLSLGLKDGEVRLRKPFIYQINEQGSRDEIPGEYVIKGKEIRLKVRAYDSTKPLIVDPVLSYATLLGTGSNEFGYDIDVDAQGNAYITGNSTAANFPTTPGAFQTTSFFGGAFVTKLDPTGSSLIYSTYLNGSSASTGTAIAVDSTGAAFVTGYTQSADFPTLNPLRGGRFNLLKTADSGTQWSPGDIGTANRAVLVLAIDNTTPTTIFAGLGAGGGIYKSVDGGNTWAQLNTGVASASCSAIAIDPVNPNTIYAALNPTNFTGNGVYKSTDGGTTWSSASSGLNGSQTTALAIDPQTPSTLYVGTTFGLFKSTNSAANWALSGAGITFGGFFSIVVDPSTPTTVYATAGGGGVFKTTNGAANWSQVNTGLTNTTVRTLALNPSVPSTLYAGTAGGGVFKTTNAGGNWSPANNGMPSNAPVNSSVINPTSTTTLYVGTNDGRIFKTTDGGSNWTSVYDNVSSTHVNSLAIDPGNPAKVYAGSDTSSQSLSDYEAFVTKLNATGSGLVYSTLLGGNLYDVSYGIAIDASGAAYVVGETNSTNFPTVNAVQPTIGGSSGCGDAFVTKLNAAGSALLFSTYHGGSGCEQALAVATDSSGNAYVTGSTSSNNFPTLGAFQSTLASTFAADAFATKFNSVGTRAYSTYLGGTGTDNGFGIAVDSLGNAHITGQTTSINFPTANPIQSTNAGFAGDAFVTKLNSAGSGLIYSTYLGGSNTDSGRGIAVDSADNAYITGSTTSADFPIVVGALRTKSPFFTSSSAGTSWNNDNYGLKSDVVTALALDPAQTVRIYAGTRAGVYRSINNGRTWNPINTGLVRPSVTAIVVDPITTSTVYIAVSFTDFANSAGVYKSIDGGDTWNAVNTGLGNGGIVTLAIDPITPTTLYASSGGGVFKTIDGGGSWAPVGQQLFQIQTLAVDPITPATVYAGANSSPGGVFKSIDGGGSWQSINNGLTSSFVLKLAIDPVTPSTIYAGLNSGLCKSVNGGGTWTSMTTGLTNTFISAFAFDPVTPSTVYAASGAFSGGLFRSINGGANWTPIINGLRYTSVSSVIVNPTSPATVHVGTSIFPPDEDAFVTKINPAGNLLVYSTFLGGAIWDSTSPNEGGSAIAVDAAGNAYVAGHSRAPDFPVTAGAYQPFNRGFSDTFIAKLTMSYIISGTVLDGASAPISGAEVILSDGNSLSSVLTGSDGSYQFTNLREGGSFVVTASKPQFTITPSSHTFNNLTSDQTANFTGSATNDPFYTLGGQVTENGMGRSGVTITLSGSQPGLRTTDTNGNYSFTLAGGGNYTVTPSALGFTFSPANLTVNNLSANQTANFVANRENFVVTNVNNHGTGSLRQAILNANATAGSDTIVFNIPGTGVQTINLTFPLPEITDPVVIDASTQPGYAGAPLIELNGAGAGSGANGLRIISGGTTIRGFAINRFNGGGIDLRTGGGNVVQGNYIGTDPTGTIARGNQSGILLSASSNNTIGGLTPAARNLIAGNSSSGINGTGSNNLIQGNYIGTNVTGTAALGSGTMGIELFQVSGGSTANNVIGGTAAGAGNLISGNSIGIRLNSTAAVIQGNLIGTDVTGTLAIPNGTGINASNFVANPAQTIIGGTSPGARNIISGNSGDGVAAGGGVKVQGNFIGTDITGTFAVGNGGNGVLAGNAALIGGTTPEARNIISGNGANGGFGNISLGSNSAGSQAVVQGNYIGTDVTGSFALNNPQAGISISGANNIIGGVTAGAPNVISGNQVGIQIGGNISPGAAVGNTIQGNLIGLNAAGTSPLPNNGAGIRISDSNNTIGGSAAAANRINFNGGTGIQVSSGTGNSIRGNSVFSNAGLGIDLNPEGVTANDLSDPDTGANNLQNSPVLSSVTSNGTSTTIVGTLNSNPGANFVIDFYANTACDGSGRGEGAQFFDSINVTTDTNGNASINFTSTQVLPAGKALVATATDPTGNTSEFSACDATNLSGSVGFSAAKYDVLEDVGNAVVKVVRVGGSKGSLSINYTTADGTATAGSDYTASSGTLVFADGETSKTIFIPIANDGISEPDETVRLSLTGFTDLETMGSYPVATIVIHENNTPLQLYALDVDVIEGNSGTTNVVVTVYLSAQTSRAVSVTYSTSGFTATPNVDYTPVSGSLTFGPGETEKTVSFSIIGDTLDEFNEEVGFVLSNAVNATIIYYPTILIVDDDPLVSLSITDVMVNEGNSGTVSAVFNVTLSAVSGKPVSVQFNTANGTASSGSDYTSTSGFLSFSPGQTSKTITVQVNGDTTIEPNETFLVNLFSQSGATLAKAQGIATILDDDGQTPLQLMLDTGSNQADVLDSLLLTRDPFTVLSGANWWDLSADPNTKVLVFVRNLQLNQGETASAVEVNLVSGNFTATIAAEDVRSLPNTDLTQVMFRLPNNLPTGICVVYVKLHGQSSNTGIFIVQ